MHHNPRRSGPSLWSTVHVHLIPVRVLGHDAVRLLRQLDRLLVLRLRLAVSLQLQQGLPIGIAAVSHGSPAPGSCRRTWPGRTSRTSGRRTARPWPPRPGGGSALQAMGERLRERLRGPPGATGSHRGGFEQPNPEVARPGEDCVVETKGAVFRPRQPAFPCGAAAVFAWSYRGRSSRVMRSRLAEGKAVKESGKGSGKAKGQAVKGLRKAVEGQGGQWKATGQAVHPRRRRPNVFNKNPR